MKKVSIALALVACLFTSIGLAQTAAPVGPVVTYEVKAPNGKTYQIKAPDGSTDLQVWQALLVQHPEAGVPKKGGKGKAPPAAPQPQTTLQDVYADMLAADAAGDTVKAKKLALLIGEIQNNQKGSTGGDPELQQVLAALRNADAAGDTAAAKRLAEIAQQIMGRTTTTPTAKSINTTATIQPGTPSMTPTNTSFNESFAIGLVLGGLLWLAGRWQWRKLNNEPDHTGKVKLESAKNFLFVTLGVDIVATTVTVVCCFWVIGIFQGISSGAAAADQSVTSNLTFLESMLWIQILTFLGVGVGLAKWFNACYLYAKEVIGATGFKQSGFASSFAWFIPLYNLFKPYQIVNEIFKSGAPGYEQPDGWKKESWSGPLLTWWLFWAFTHSIWWMLGLVLKNSKLSGVAATSLQAGILVSSVIIALLWFVVAGSLTRRLLDRSNSVTVAPVAPSHQAPPRPPSPPIAPSHQTSNLGSVPSPVVAREPTRSTPKPQVTTSEEEAIYEQALTELNSNKKPGLWAMALAQTATSGNPDGAYIALRVEQLKQEKLREKEQESTDSSAAEFDYKFAMLHYTHSEHVEPSIHAAFDYFGKAARHGHPAAQEKLASMYWSDGEVAIRDIATAFAWCSIAAANGNGEARIKLPLIKQQMSPADLARAIEIQAQLRNEQTKSGEESPKLDAVAREALAQASPQVAVDRADREFRTGLVAASKGNLTADKFNSFRATLIQYRSPIDAAKLLRLCGYTSFKPGEDLRAPLKYVVCKSVDATIIAEFDSEMELVDWVVSQVEVVGASHRV